MHLMDPVLLGVGILVLLAALVVVKQRATGVVLDQPKGDLLIQVVNIFNLFFLLVVNPLAAVVLITRSLPGLDPTHYVIQPPWLLTFTEVLGLLLYVGGFALMSWALITLGRNYQLGGSAPRAKDRIVTQGPYGLIRHPMYSAALGISLGLACLIQSCAFFGVFLIYVVLILRLVPVEERLLATAYGRKYAAYRGKTKALIPALY